MVKELRITELVSVLALALCLAGCVGIAPGITPVEDFDVNRYLGKWYEIARLDHSFERGLDRVTAEYSLRDGGGIRVINSGYSESKGKRKVAEGKAYFVSEKTKGHLKVSFFGPFYGSYIIFELDKEGYEYAFITSYKKDYLWLLSREPHVDPALIERFIAVADKNGFNTSELIYPQHD